MKLTDVADRPPKVPPSLSSTKPKVWFYGLLALLAILLTITSSVLRFCILSDSAYFNLYQDSVLVLAAFLFGCFISSMRGFWLFLLLILFVVQFIHFIWW